MFYRSATTVAEFYINLQVSPQDSLILPIDWYSICLEYVSFVFCWVSVYQSTHVYWLFPPSCHWTRCKVERYTEQRRTRLHLNLKTEWPSCALPHLIPSTNHTCDCSSSSWDSIATFWNMSDNTYHVLHAFYLFVQLPYFLPGLPVPRGKDSTNLSSILYNLWHGAWHPQGLKNT